MKDKAGKMRTFAIALAVFFAARLIFSLIFIQHGFDLSDESFHMLTYWHGAAYTSNIHTYHLLLAPLWGLIEPNLLNLRLVQILLSISAACVFYHGLSRFISERILFGKMDRVLWWAGLLFILNGTLLSPLDRVVSYNPILEASSLILGGCLFIIALPRSGREGRIASFAAGILIVFATLIKPTSVILLVLLSLLLLVLRHNYKDWRRLHFSAFLLGCFSMVLYFLFCIQWNLSEFTSIYLQGIEDTRLMNYGNPKLLAVLYLFPLIEVIFICFLPIWLFFRIKRNPSPKYVAGFLLSIAIAAFLIVTQVAPAYNLTYFKPVTPLYEKTVYLFLMLIFIFALARNNAGIDQLKEIRWLTLLLLILPIPFLFGSMSPMSQSYQGYLPLLMGIVWIWITFNAGQTRLADHLLRTGLVVVLLSLGLFTIQNTILAPRQLISPTKMNTKVNMEPYGSFITDEATANFISAWREISDALPNLSSTYYVSLQCGMTLTTGKPQPATPMLLSVPEVPLLETGHTKYTCKIIADDENLFESLLAIDSDADHRHFPCFADALHRQSGHYEVHDSIFNPYLERKRQYFNPDVKPFTYLYIPKKDD